MTAAFFFKRCSIALMMLSSSLALANDASQTTSAAPQRSQLPLEDLRNFAEVFERIRSVYVEEVDDKTLLEYAINGMLTSLDPHSAYLQEEAFSELQENTSGKFGGLGLEVGMEDGLLSVITPIDDTPAQKAGIRTGDVILSINNEAVMGMNLNEAVSRMRGEPGSNVVLEIRRQGENKTLNIHLTRAEIKVASVRTELLSDQIGYVRITQFQENTGSELVSAINDWQEKQPIKGLILDLRNNPGGVLDAAVEVVDAFISQGLIVYTEGRAESSKISYSATQHTPVPSIPVVVLINGGSASASEIVAGALQDHQRALVIGTQSFGKGSVQSVLPITDTRAVKLTTARYFTPNGRSIQAQGIRPDIWIEQSEVTPFEQRYYKEADLPGHLRNNTQTPEAEKAQQDELHNTALLKKDFQLYEAHTLLRGVSILSPRTEP